MSRRDDEAPLGGKVVAFTVLGLAVLVGAAWVALSLYAGDRTPRSARVEGVSIGGLDAARAEDTLRRELRGRVTQPIVVSYGDGRVSQVEPASAGLEVDYAASVVAAGGGDGWSPERLWEFATGGGNHRAVVTVDEQKMQAALDLLARGIARPPVNGTVVFQQGRAVGVAGRPGLVVDRSAARSLLLHRFLRQGSQKLPMLVRRPVVTADEVNRALGAFGREAMSGPVSLVIGGQRVVATPSMFGRALSMRVQGGRLVPQVDGEVLMQELAPAMPTVGRQPVDAEIRLTQGRVVVVPARVGISFDADALETGFAAALTRRGEARRVVVPGEVRAPRFTTAAARALRVRQVVSRFTVRFPYAEPRNTNLARAASLVDGALLRPRQTFSLNGALGEGSGEITPLSTAVFNAMFFAGLEHVDRTSTRVHTAGGPFGREATVVWPSADLRFTNDSPYGVLLTAKVRPATPRRAGTVTVSMWSTKRWSISARTASCQPVPGSPAERHRQDRNSNRKADAQKCQTAQNHRLGIG